MVIEGKVYYKSVIRDAKDPQRVYNYMLSQNVEMTALAPKVPYKITPKQIAGHENQWNNINARPFPYALYNPDPEAPGAPQREGAVTTNPGLIQLGMTATDDMKDATGIYDASVGAASNETSGRAIMARQREGDVGSYEFIDNLTRAIQFTGKVLVDLIPKIYDTERTVRTLGEDDTPQQVVINRELSGPNGERVLVNDITVGKYDVMVTVGPSFTTQRMENAEALQTMVQAAPMLAPVLIPRWVKMMDWPDAAQLAEEIKAFTQQQTQPPGMPPGGPQQIPQPAALPEGLPPEMVAALASGALDEGGMM
jgi:hypothetical protein